MFNNVFEAAKSVSMKEIIQKYSNVSVDTGRYGGNISCPLGFHSDNKASFHIYPNTNSFHCFSCKNSGSPIDYVKLVTGLVSNVDAAKDICDTFNISYEDNYQVNTDYDNYVKVYNWVAQLFVKCNSYNNALDYWKSRGLDSLVDKYSLGYCPSVFTDSNNTVITFKSMLKKQFPNIPDAILDSYNLYDAYGQCVFADRYMFAIRNSKGDVVAFSGRSLTDQAKYKNSKETKYFQKRKILYNLDKAKGYPFVYIVEGQCDALSLVVSGIPNAVASLGTAFTSEHLELLKGKDIILAFDNDNAGHSTMAKLIEDNPDVKLLVLDNSSDNYKDFNEALMSGVDLKADIDKKKRLYGPEFLFVYLKNTLDLSQLSNREELHSRVSKVAKNSSPIAKDYYAIKIQRLFKGKRSK